MKADELGLAIAAVGVGVTAAGVLIAAMVSLAIGVLQVRAARAAWRRDQLASRYVTVSARLNAILQHVQLADKAYGAPRSDPSDALLNEYDRLDSDFQEAALAAALVSERAFLPVWAARYFPREELFPRAPGSLTPGQNDVRKAALRFVTDFVPLVTLAMRRDLGLAPGRKFRRRLRSHSESYANAAAAHRSRFERMSVLECVTHLAGLQVLANAGTVLRATEDAYVQAAPDLVDRLDRRDTREESAAAIVVSKPEHYPVLVVRHGLSDDHSVMLMREVARAASKNFNGVGDYRSTPEGEFYHLWAVDDQGPRVL